MTQPTDNLDFTPLEMFRPAMPQPRPRQVQPANIVHPLGGQGFYRGTGGTQYGMRYIEGKWSMHNGIDIFAPGGTPILASSKGQVVAVGSNDRSGNFIRVYYPGIGTFGYAHMNAPSQLKVGASVDPGQVLGGVG